MKTTNPANPPAPNSGAAASDSEETATPANLEEALARLDAILARMEEGQEPLERLLEDYETGARLLRVCHERLAAAEKRILAVTRSLDGSIGLTPFDPGADTPTA